MKIRIKTYNGELPSYLTVGKVYICRETPYFSGWLETEDGVFYIHLDNYEHLNGGSWEVVSE